MTPATTSGKAAEWSMSSGTTDQRQDLAYVQVSLVPQLPAYPTQLINIKRMIVKT